MSPIIKFRTLRYNRSFCIVFFDAMPSEEYEDIFGYVASVVSDIVDDFQFHFLRIYIDCYHDPVFRYAVKELKEPMYWRRTKKLALVRPLHLKIRRPLNPYYTLSAKERAKLQVK